MTQTYNPFNEGVAGDFFVGREAQLSAIERSIAGLQERHPKHLYIAGAHGSGKTSLLAKTGELAEAAGCVVVACTVDAPATPRAQVNALVRAVVKATDGYLGELGRSQMHLQAELDKSHGAFRSVSNERLHADDLLNDLRVVEKQLQGAGKPAVLVTFDEAQRMDPYALSAIKNAFQHLRSYLLILSLRIDEPMTTPAREGRKLLEALSEAAEGDRGAGRLFVTGLEVGPFDSKREAIEAISKRLDDNAISFAEQVLEYIAAASGRVPRDAISLAAAVYEQAADDHAEVATTAHFHRGFIYESPDVYERAKTQLTVLSPSERRVVASLATFENAVQPEQVTRHAYPSVQHSQLAPLVEGVTSMLDRLRSHPDSLVHATAERRYCILGSRQRFALVLAEAGV